VVIHFDREKPCRFFALPKDRESQYELLKAPLAASAAGPGLLVMAHVFGQPPSIETLRVCTTIAGSSNGPTDEGEETRPRWRLMPRGLEWKARALGRLNGRILERARFMDLALRSVEDGLIIAGPDGRITYANRRAAAILGSSDRTLIGRELFKRLAEAEGGPEADIAGRKLLEKLLVDRAKIEREIAINGVRSQRYTLQLAAVSASDDSGSLVLGIVASLSDITRQYELQQTKNDVVALVSHEMRTPLTAIQGMSELLANYDLDPERRREMNVAINDEAKRLTRMIGEYLDIARLESGATVLRRVPLRVEPLLDRTLLLLEPIATQRGIRLDRRLSSRLPVLLADGDLL
jgi:PAS domain S-box-containing protein